MNASSSGYHASDAAAYERFIGRWSRRLADEIVRGVPYGERGECLDVGCGTGSLVAALAAHDPGRNVTGVDSSPAYIDYARRRNDVGNAEFLLCDAEALNLQDDRFDASFAVLALNFMTDPARAMQEMRRVTVPGGVVVAAGWDFRGGLVYQRLLWDTAAGIDPTAAELRDRLFSHPLAKPNGLADLMRGAGLENVIRECMTIRMDFAEFADYWEPLLGGQGPVGSYVARLSPELGTRVRDAVCQAFLSGDVDGPRSLAATAWVVHGTVPQQS